MSVRAVTQSYGLSPYPPPIYIHMTLSLFLFDLHQTQTFLSQLHFTGRSSPLPVFLCFVSISLFFLNFLLF